MHALISQISASALSQQLYCWLSMHDLCIVQTEVSYPYNGPLLRVSPLSNGAIEFRYEDTAIKERQWCRQVLPEEASAQLAKFLAQLHWLSSSVGAAANKSFKADA
jgi:hypothetical protein